MLQFPLSALQNYDHIQAAITMCKSTSTTEAAPTQHFDTGEEELMNKCEETKPMVHPQVRISQLFDPNENWVLVENGSYANHFDSLPKSFRVGPWNIACCMYIFGIFYWVLFNCVECYTNPPQHHEYTYHDVNTWQWKYSAATCLWTFYIAHGVTKTDLGWYSWMSYTLQSWTLIMLRHTLSTLVPFFPSLAPWNEYLRFPMILQATIVFIIWNLAVMPAVFTQLKTQESRKAFSEWCFNFLLVNLHFMNLVFAAFSAIWGSPARELNKIDLCVALVCSFQYILVYFFLFDRLGLHFYFIFSPRSILALVSYTTVLGCIYAGFALWKGLIMDYGHAA